MTAQKFTALHCSVCGKTMGKTMGVRVLLGLVCDDPICNYQSEVTANEQRDAFIVAGALENISPSQIAYATGVSRQRVYQIIDAWKRGV